MLSYGAEAPLLPLPHVIPAYWIQQVGTELGALVCPSCAQASDIYPEITHQQLFGHAPHCPFSLGFLISYTLI